MLPKVCGLLERDSGLTFNQKPVKVLFKQCLDSFRQIAHDLGLEMVDLVGDGECQVLKDRVGVYR